MEANNIALSIVIAFFTALPGILAFWAQIRRDKTDLSIKQQEVSMSMMDRQDSKINLLEEKLEKERIARIAAEEKIALQAKEISNLSGALTKSLDAHEERNQAIARLEQELSMLKRNMTS